MKYKSFFTVLSLLFIQVAAHAQVAGQPIVTHSLSQGEFVNDTVLFLTACVILVLLAAFAFVLHNNRMLVQAIYNKSNPAVAKAAEAEEVKAHTPGVLQKLYNRFVMEPRTLTEEELLLDHNYDGIRELDNKMPPWWVYGFYATIIVAGIYMYRYIISDDWSSKKQYEQEMVDANKEKEARLSKEHNKVDEDVVVRLTDAASLGDGKKIFMDKCMACHGASGEGLVGPNLTDEYWIHGGSINDVFKTIKYGVPQKGMLTWNGQLTAQQIQQVASYVLSLQGTNPPNAKAPQGDKYVPAAGANDKAAAADTTHKAATK